MQIRMADEADLSEIHSLLRANDLPVEDISTALIEGFLVVEGASGSIIGISGQTTASRSPAQFAPAPHHLSHRTAQALSRSMIAKPVSRRTG
jgi:hypothetical protein